MTDEQFEREKHTNDLLKLERKLGRLNDMYLDESCDKAYYQKHKEKIVNAISILRSRLAFLTPPPSNIVERFVNELVQVAQIVEDYSNLSVERRRDLIETLGIRFIIDDTGYISAIKALVYKTSDRRGRDSSLQPEESWLDNSGSWWRD